MTKAICSKVDLSVQGGISELYNNAVSDLLECPEVKRLELNMQHLETSRLQHSINVSYYSFLLARRLNADERAAARAGLLHDLYFYNYKDERIGVLLHSSLHPVLALENAKKVTSLSENEENIILTHMWPMTGKAPRNIEGYIVTFADKGCTLLEVTSRLWRRFVRKVLPAV